jgi:hypothetical protein
MVGVEEKRSEREALRPMKARLECVATRREVAADPDR